MGVGVGQYISKLDPVSRSNFVQQLLYQADMVPVLVTNTIKRMKIFGNRHSHCSLLLNIGFFFLAQQQVFHTCIVKIPRIDFF